MTLAASFKEYYSRPTTGAVGNNNVNGFNAAMNFETTRREAAQAFNNADGTILYAGQDKKIKIIHGLKDLGNSIIRPESKIGGHMGLNGVAFVGHIDLVEALSLTTFNTPTDKELADCITIEALRELQLGDTTAQFEGPKVFLPAPFLQRAVIHSGSYCPMELIFKVREAYTEHIVNLDTPLVDAIDAHVELFEQFCWGVHNGKITTNLIFTPDADDVELMSFSKEYHASRINSEGTTASIFGAAPTGGGVYSHGNIETLASTLTRVIEEQGSTASILEKMHQHVIDKDVEKKEKSEKWHQSTKKLVCFAASSDGSTPAMSIPLSFRKLINAETLGNAEVELIAQMRASGHEEVEWDPTLTNSLRHGMLLYTRMETPSNFSIFMIRVKNPTALNEQQAKGMNLHILELGKDNNKNIMEMIQASKNSVKIPTNIEDLLIIIKGFGGLAAIVFGNNSSLTSNLKQLARDLHINKVLLKGRIMNDPTLIAKLMYTIDNRTQMWLSYLLRATDREDVNDHIIDFIPVMNEIVLDTFQVNLPATFAPPKIKKEDEDNTEEPPRKRKRRGENENEKENKVVNNNIPTEFRLLEGEDYKAVFSGRCVEDRPIWNVGNAKCRMCPRWWIIGICFRDCRNAKSHVPTSDLPANKKSAFVEFLEKARRE